MKVTFIGTGSGKTSLKLYHSSIVFSFKNNNLLVDAGDGVSRALLNAGIDYNSINGILFTHLHPDHFSGVAALIVQMKMLNRNTLLEIYSDKYSSGVIKNFLIACNLLPEKMNFEIRFKPFIDNKEFVIDGLRILPRENSHLSELKKFKQYPEQGFYSASFLFSYLGKNLLYTADIGSAEDLELFNEFNIDILICEFTHINAAGLLEKLKLISPQKVYLTHISDEEHPRAAEFLNTIPGIAGDIKLAKERQIIEF